MFIEIFVDRRSKDAPEPALYPLKEMLREALGITDVVAVITPPSSLMSEMVVKVSGAPDRDPVLLRSVWDRTIEMLAVYNKDGEEGPLWSKITVMPTTALDPSQIVSQTFGSDAEDPE